MKAQNVFYHLWERRNIHQYTATNRANASCEVPNEVTFGLVYEEEHAKLAPRDASRHYNSKIHISESFP